MCGAGQATAELELFEKDEAGNWPMELRVCGLPAGRYELWLTRDGKLAEPCGAFAVAAGETTVPLNAPYRLGRSTAGSSSRRARRRRADDVGAGRRRYGGVLGRGFSLALPP